MASLPESVVRKIPQWKNDYGDIYFWVIGNISLIYRGLTLREFRDFSELAEKSQPLSEDFLLEKAILWKEADINFDAFPAAAVGKLIEKIIEASGLTSIERFAESLNKARAFAQTAEGFSIALISHAFSLDPEEVSNFSLHKLTKYLALAEIATGKVADFDLPGSKKKKGRRRGFNPANQITSPEAADKPDFNRDNFNLRQFSFYGNDI